MWLFTRHGFFSVVAKQSDPDMVKIRARCVEDLEGLRAFIGRADLEIIETPKRDYCCRMFMPKAEWVTAAERLAEDLNYTNFKDTVHGEFDRDQAYMNVWCTMLDLQRRRRRHR